MDFKKLHLSFAILFGILAVGTIGYYFVENMSFFDAFYMTIITISTVGFSEIKPLSPYGRFITIIVISASISIGAYSTGVIVRVFIEGELKKSFGRRRVEKLISKLKDHFIICGFGRIGRIICEELYADNIDLVVIEQESAEVERVENEGFFCLQMDATSGEALIKAGIMNARGLVTSVNSDANNVFIILTAKELRPDIFILSRASDMKHEGQLKRAGANRVVSPYLIGGRRMAQILKRPTVVDFIDVATIDSQLGLMMEEAKLGPGSPFIGKNLIESNLRKDFGVIIVAIKKLSGDMIFNPIPSEKLEGGDVIVVLGKRDDLRRMNEII
ncbi:potassium channel protein [Desulfococcaceae bacterium HSG8]|nr:potassium channel protein [Desulfococcaceae bacterium HSG8]